MYHFLLLRVSPAIERFNRKSIILSGLLSAGLPAFFAAW
jgi:hypothetical protein